MKKKHQAVPSCGTTRNRRRVAEQLQAQEASEAIIRQVRTAYVQARQAFERNYLGRESTYKVPKRYDGIPAVEDDSGNVIEKAVVGVWGKLARFFSEKKIDPLAYIQAQFASFDLTEVIIEPPQLMCDSALRRWKQFKHKKAEEVVLALSSQRNIARSRIVYLQRFGKIEAKRSYAMVLLDSGLALSVLFRYCLARSLNGRRFAKIAERYELDAAIQYQRYRRHYDEHWKELIPKGFAKRSRLIHKYLFEALDDYEDKTST